MHFKIKYFILLLNLLFIKCSGFRFENRTIFDIDEMDSNKAMVPVEIISSYLHEYLNPQKVYLSISYSSSNDEHKYFQEEFIAHLVKQWKVRNFSSNILYKIYQLRRGNRNIFNVILIDESASLK